jgi:hypothetical protein
MSEAIETPLPASMRNHWWWRPGWREGRHIYACHLTFDDQPQLRELVADYQQALSSMFSGATFSDDAWFDEATFSGYARFGEATADRGPDAFFFADAHVRLPDASHVSPRGWHLENDTRGEPSIVRGADPVSLNFR